MIIDKRCITCTHCKGQHERKIARWTNVPRKIFAVCQDPDLANILCIGTVDKKQNLIYNSKGETCPKWEERKNFKPV